MWISANAAPTMPCQGHGHRDPTTSNKNVRWRARRVPAIAFRWMLPTPIFLQPRKPMFASAHMAVIRSNPHFETMHHVIRELDLQQSRLEI
jgi:hypothetical protein